MASKLDNGIIAKANEEGVSPAEILVTYLNKNGLNVAKTAEMLGVTRKTVYRAKERFNIVERAYIAPETKNAPNQDKTA